MTKEEKEKREIIKKSLTEETDATISQLKKRIEERKERFDRENIEDQRLLDNVLLQKEAFEKL